MKKELVRRVNESDRDYLTRVAAIIAELKSEGEEDEAYECYKAVGVIIVPIMEQFIDCESVAYKLDGDTKCIFSEKVYDVVERDFYKFNNPDYMKSEDKWC